MHKQLVFIALMLLATFGMAQKPKQAVEFDRENLTTDLQAMFEKAATDKAEKKENARVTTAFAAAYTALQTDKQQRVTDLFNYAVKAKLKPQPDMVDMARVATTYATAPQGADNLEGWITAMETFAKRNAKGKYVNEFVAWSELLINDRILYRSASSEWSFAATTPYRLVVENKKIVVHIDAAADLNYASGKDWSTVHGVRGWFDYTDGIWHGEGGRIDWARTGLKAEACYADLSTWQAEVKFPKFKADSVSFVNTHYFSSPISGRIEEQLSGTMEPEKYQFPRFRSYQRDFVIPNIMPEVDYSGTFMMNGSKFVTASSKHPARLLFRQGEKTRLAVTSLNFTITPERLTAENAQVALYLTDDDSISNNGILVRYLPAEKKVTLVNDQQRKFYSPFIDSYHEMDIYSENIVWLMGQDRLEFSNLASAGAVSSASFESSNCYTYKKYRDIQGIDEVSPVRRVYDYAESNTYNFGIKGFSNYIGLDMSQTLLMIHTLCRHGLVTYNEINGRVLVKQKLEDYVKANARAKGFDYDALSLESSSRGVNARLSLADNELLVRGVEQFVVSDSHQVVVHPDSASGYQVRVGRNRALHFSGKVECNKFILQVKDCDYSYEQHRFEMPTIERLEFYVPDFDNPDYEQLVRTPLSGLSGSLEVDKPNNHCGLKKNKQYPILTSRENCFVYYDRRTIQGGKYKRASFYYTIHPFALQSLADFKVDSLQFGGALTSAGIFPELKEPLKVQRDYFLGFTTKTPQGGLPAYGGKGVYHDELKLDGGGLHGRGHVDYISAHLSSRNVLFLPDSALAVTDTVVVREEQGMPKALGGRMAMNWIPYRDSLDIATPAQGRGLRMFRDEATLQGHLALMPQGAMAGGQFEVREATLTSNRFDLQPRQMETRVSSFVLHSNTFHNTAFEAEGVSSNVDYEARRAELTMPDGPQITHLQLMQYDAYADHFAWDMDKHTLDIDNSKRGSSEGLDAMDIRLRLPKAHDLPGVEFVSTDPKRDHLAYHSLLSSYHYEKADLRSRGVYLIMVADAAIAPAGDSLRISKGGEMQVLNGAQLLCDRQNAYHHITDAYLMIEGANNYSGKGYIHYPEGVDTAETQRIYLSDITCSNGTTTANGTIADEASFRLGSAFGFAGKVRMEAARKELYFDGGVRLLQDCIDRERVGLLAYADYTDPNQIHVTVPELPTDWRGKRISASILLDKSTLAPTPAFLTVDRATDNELLSAHGLLTYLNESMQYMIASADKVANPDATIEPYLALNTMSCTVEGEGEMDFTLKRTQANFYTYGTAKVGLRDNTEDMIHTVFGFGFPIDNSLVDAIREALKDDLRLVPSAPHSDAPMRHALMHHLGAEPGTKAYATFSEQGKLSSIPEPMRTMLLFSDVRWQHLEGVGLYCDTKCSLVAIDGKPLGLDVRLKGQINKRGNAQIMTLYVEAARDHWYFFRFDLMSQELTIYSSVGTFEDAVKALPAEKRRVERDGLGTFRYHIGQNRTEVSTWLTNFSKSIYTDIDD